MEEIIDKLSYILQEIEGYHGIVHNASSYDHVKQLHQQTRDHVAELRKSLQEHDADCPIRLAAAWLEEWQHKEPQS